MSSPVSRLCVEKAMPGDIDVRHYHISRRQWQIADASAAAASPAEGKKRRAYVVIIARPAGSTT